MHFTPLAIILAIPIVPATLAICAILTVPFTLTSWGKDEKSVSTQEALEQAVWYKN